MPKLLLIITLISIVYSVQAQDKKVLVCEGKSSYAYHDHVCQGLKECKAKIVEMTVSKAASIARKPCGYCYKNSGSPKSGSSSKISSANSGQCSAITKKGSRCSRAARSGGYCWQHGG